MLRATYTSPDHPLTIPCLKTKHFTRTALTYTNSNSINMPFIIKSNNGKRSYQMVTNTSKNDADVKLRDTIIDALKGLTFKFEVKITDVLTPEQNGPEEKLSSSDRKQQNGFSMKQEQTNCNEKPESVEAAITRPKTTYQRDELLALNQQPISALVERAFTDTAQVKCVKVDESKSDAPKWANSRDKPELIKNSSATTTQTESTVNKKSLPVVKPKYPRGSMSIGTEMRTVCVAVSDSIPPVAHIAYDSEEIANITNSIMDISSEIELEPEVSTVHVGDIVFAKSTEDNEWYRAIVEAIKEQVYIKVHYLDWGLSETLSSKRIRRLNRPELGLSQHPACAVRIMFSNEDHPKFEEVLSCQVEFNMKVVSYDESTQIYKCTIIS